MTAVTAPGGVTRGADGVARYDDLAPSLVAAWRAAVERDPRAPAVVEVGGPRWTHAELWYRASRVAGGLRAAGVHRGDRVVLALPNSAAWCAAFLGAVLAGAVAVPLDGRHAAGDLDELVADCGARAVLRTPDDLPRGAPTAVDDLGPDDPVAIFYTSGTTGAPKGAVMTHRNVLTNSETALRALHRDDPEPPRELVSVPLSHVTGCHSQLLPTLQAGGATVVMPRFAVPTFLEVLAAEAITSIMSVPAVYAMVLGAGAHGALARAARTVRSVTYGGAPADDDLVRGLRACFPAARLGSGYGMTECSSFAAHLPDEHVDAHPGSVGFAVPVVDLALRGTDGTGVGELCVRGPNVVAGYWGAPDGSGETFGPDGWLRTGDLASITDDGLVTIAGRAKDVIIRGGRNVHAAHVERVLGAHPDVAEVAVVGVPDRVAGEKVAAALVPAVAAPDLRAVFRAARDRLDRHEVPELVDVRDRPLPRNAGGKLVKQGLAAAATWRVAPR